MTIKIRTFLGFLVALAFATAVYPQQSTITLQWSYTNTTTSPATTTYYPSKAQAVAAMQASKPGNSVLTVPQLPNNMSGNSVQYPYTAPTLQPNYGTWTYDVTGQYTQCANSSCTYSTEAAAAAYYAIGEFPNQCGIGTATPTGPWSSSTYYSNGGNFAQQSRPYSEMWPSYDVYANPQCGPLGVGGTEPMGRFQPVTCPAYYVLTTSPTAACIDTATDFIVSTPIPCPGSAAPGTSTQVGDPCDAMNGEFSQTETDYSGPALTLTRNYHSATVSAPTGIGIGWTHNFAASVIVNYGYPNGLIRPDGHHDPLYYEDNGYYETTSGDGLHLGRTSSGGYMVYLPDGGQELYNASGVLIQLTSAGGAITTLNYTGSLLSSVVGPFGHTLSFAYNGNGNISSVTDPAGNTIAYSYDGVGNLASVKYQDGSTRTYQYKNTTVPNNLTGILDENNAQYLSVTYDSYGRASTSQNAGGANYVSLAFNSTSATVVDGLGGQTIFDFVASSQSTPRVTSVSHSGLTSNYVVPTYSQDFQLRATQMTDPNGNVTEYNYDMEHLTSKIEAVGTPLARTTSYQYLAAISTLPTLVTEPLRQTSIGYYPGTNNVQTKTITDTSVTPNVSRTWTYTYNSYGQVLTVDGPRTDVSDVTTYTYYTCTTGTQCGQVETIQNALGQTTTFNTYNAHGQPLTITDPNGIVTTLTYDARLRLTSRQVGTGLPGAETTGYSYYPTGLLETVTLPDSSVITYGYDGAHRLTDITDTLGNHIHYTLDALGNHTAEDTYDPTNTLRRAHTRVINTLNQLYQDVNAAGTSSVTTTYGYDNNGNLTSAKAPLSRNTANTYDALNRLSQITDPANGKTVFAYDSNDNLTNVQDPRSLNTTYTRNGFGDVTKLVSPDTGTTVSTYDSGGNLKTATDARSAVATYTYDALNRVTQQSYTDQTINYSYDVGTNGKGRLTGASDAYHSMSWVYDALGRVTGKGETVGSVTKSVGYAYTNNDLVKLVTPSGQTVTYAYTNHQITQIAINGTTLLSGVTYFPYGPVSGWTWGNATTVSRGYDQDGNPASIVTAATTNTYTVDAASRITGLTDSTLSSNSWTFGYDLLDRVTSGSSSAKSRGYTYDANGNRLTTTGTTPSTETVSTTSNQLNATSGSLVRTYAYDKDGNTLSFTGYTFTYDQRGRMLTAATSAGTTTYIYNALGQLIQKSGNGGTTVLVYDEAGHLLGEYGSGGALIQETIWMGDTPVATIRPNGTTSCTTTVCVFYVHSDHLNSPRKVTRSADNGLLWRWDPDTFGSSTSTPNGNPANLGAFVYNLRFPGQYFLTETGLSQNYFRDYDPAVGRYVESDPIGLQGGSFSTYAYVGGNPVGNIDPFGLQVVVAGPSPGLNTIVCDGQGNIVTQLQLFDPVNDKCISDCILVHEMSHADDVILKYGPSGVCQNKSKGQVLGWPNDAQRIASERKAYAAELNCLQAKLAKITCDDKCRAAIMTRITQIKPYVTNPPSPPRLN